MPPRLRQRPDRPAHVPEQLEDAQIAGRNATAGQLGVSIEERLGLPYPAERQGIAPEAPGANQRPGEVLARIADVGELPVEDAGKTGFSDHQVADAEIPVADDARAVTREVPAQAQEPELDGRMRLSDLVELCLEHIERSAQG